MKVFQMKISHKLPIQILHITSKTVKLNEIYTNSVPNGYPNSIEVHIKVY